MTRNLRLFIALPMELPRPVLWLSRKMADQQGLKPVRPENMHLTLRFLGNTPEANIKHLEQALEAAVDEWRPAHNRGPLELELRGLGAFPPRGPPRAVWVGLAGRDLPLLMDLARHTEEQLVSSNFGAADKQFKPHLTLARVRDKRANGFVRRMLQLNRESELGKLELDRMALFSSQLTPRGPIYTSKYTVAL